ncbi:hypothetical protein NCCP28_42960 [Niallia sp. NCCP-28]|nr:hypothetical protein NCCP28_42960 [Niallia sp. NCCP-28]
MDKKDANYCRLVGMRLRAARMEHNWSREELEYRSGVSYNHIGKIERGEAHPKLKTFHLLLKALGINSNQFLQSVEKELNEQFPIKEK